VLVNDDKRQDSDPGAFDGAEAVQNRRYLRQVGICKQVGLFAIAATACYQLVYLLTDPAYYQGILLINLAFMLVYALGIGLNASHHHFLARNVVIINAAVHVFFVNIFIGSEAGVHLFYFGLGSLLSFQFYPIRLRTYTLYMAVLTALFLICHFLFDEQTALSPVPSPLVDVIYAGSATGLVILIGVTLYLFGQSIEDSEQTLTRLSKVDQLTGLANRHHMKAFLDATWAQACRNQQPLSILLGDVDHFKRYNDAHGHPAGDQCLKQVSQVFHSKIQRQADLVVRYGGEEILVILSQTDLDGALQKAGEIRRSVEDLKIINEGEHPPSPVTISFGVASSNSPAGTTPEKLIQMADKALYKAKSGGRNRVETLSSNV
jgi:diguanylate cyclase (GGDEF)-like protein